MAHTFSLGSDLKTIPRHAQTQESLEIQLRTLHAVANKLGLYDAADVLKRSMK